MNRIELWCGTHKDRDLKIAPPDDCLGCRQVHETLKAVMALPDDLPWLPVPVHVPLL